MRHLAVPSSELEPVPINLDKLGPPTDGELDILDAEIVEYRGPLDADPVTGHYPTALRGGVVVDPAEVEAIRGRARRCRLWRWLR